MNPSPFRKLNRSASESILRRTASFSTAPSRTIDPFSHFSSKPTKKTPVLRPTCHKHTNSEKTNFFPLASINTPKYAICPLMASPKLPRKVVKKAPVTKPNTNFFVFTEKNPSLIHQPVNPTFSTRNSDRSTGEEIKPVYRSNKVQMVPVKLKVPSLNKRMMKRVSSLVFREHSRSNKTALNISFDNPECFF